MELPLNCRHEHDSSICLSLLRRAADHLAIPGIAKYATLFEAIRRRVYSTTAAGTTVEPREPNALSDTGGTIAPHTSEYVDLDGASFNLMPQQLDPETYRDQLSGFFDNDILAEDDVLFTWYEAIVRDA